MDRFVLSQVNKKKVAPTHTYTRTAHASFPRSVFAALGSAFAVPLLGPVPRFAALPSLAFAALGSAFAVALLGIVPRFAVLPSLAFAALRFSFAVALLAIVSGFAALPSLAFVGARFGQESKPNCSSGLKLPAYTPDDVNEH